MMSTGTARARSARRLVALAGAVVFTFAIPAWPRAGVCVVDLELESVLPMPEDLDLRSPSAIAVDHRGNLLVADSGNHRVVVLTADGEQVTEYGGYGWGKGQFDRPSDLSVYAGFYTYVLDEGNRRVVRFDVDGDYVDKIVQEGEAGSPAAIAVGRSGELLVVDEDSQSVLVRSQFDEELEPLGRFGTGKGGFVDPVAVAVGPRGEVAVADPGKNAVPVLDEFGTSLYEATHPETLSPSDVLFDRGGGLIVADPIRATVTAFPPGGGHALASISFETTFVPRSIALLDDSTLVVLDSEHGSILFIRMTHADCGVGR